MTRRQKMKESSSEKLGISFKNERNAFFDYIFVT